MNNFSNGNGHPYWYEWSVGLLYAVKMLNPDNHIENVTLQSTISHSLDDVVVAYNDGTVECIQVKNTREKDILSFSDMIYADEDGKSYLFKFSSEWKKMMQTGNANYKVILFTNREIGKRKHTPKGSWQRPPLSKFWSEITTQLKSDSVSNISHITIKEEWKQAWTKWKEEMSELSDDEKFTFLNSLTIMSDQQDLDGIIKSIEKELQMTFGINHLTSVELHQRLCYKLMWWSTTLREKEEINCEDVMEALSLGGDQIEGNHTFPICEPFFPSRIEFINTLENRILNGKSNVTFLTGEPGCGKTNIISYLSCKPGSIVTLRFHTFKPILPGELYFSPDNGIFDARTFWGNLLIMLRDLFKGKLYEYKIPISVELIENVEKLRAEVLRLAIEWAKISGKPSVIVIDGIDHAARSGRNNTFLNTLFLPEEVPDGIRFVLAGQPIYQYPEYPDFLADEDRIEVITVPHIQMEDLKILYENKKDLMKFDDVNKDLLLSYILNMTKGNTLSAVFSIQEATRYTTFDEYEKNSNVNIFATSVGAYYEYIWKTALRETNNDNHVLDMYITSVFSMFNRKITADVLNNIFPDAGISVIEWENILCNLYPIITFDNLGYSVFHNDVRIYLTKHYKKAKSFSSLISGKVADFLLKDSFDRKIKHEMIFHLLKDANRSKEYIDIFNYKYVIEAFVLHRNISEINEQMEMTLNTLLEIDDKRKIIDFSCAVTTIYQYNESLRWHDKTYQDEKEIPFALECEQRTVPDALLTLNDLLYMFRQVAFLADNDEENRAKHLLERWIGQKSPKSLIKLFKKTPYKDNQKEYAKILVAWGKYARKFKLPYPNEECINEQEQIFSVLFSKGWFQESKNYLGAEQIAYSYHELTSEYFDPIALEDFYEYIIESNDYESIILILSDQMRQALNLKNKISSCVWAIKNKRIDLCKDWLLEIKIQEFDIVSDNIINNRRLEYEKERDRFQVIANVMYILSYLHTADFRVLVKNGLNKSKFKNDSNERIVANNILIAIYYLVYIEEQVSKNCLTSLNVENFEATINLILDRHKYSACFGIDSNKPRIFLLTGILQLYDFLTKELQNILLTSIQNKTYEHDDICLFEVYYSFLVDCGQIELVKNYFDSFMSKDGLIWNQDLSERDFVSDKLINIAEKLKWTERIKEAEYLLSIRRIGYVGRKDYSLYTPLKWFERLIDIDPIIWKSEGLLLLNISKYASSIGDNRATVPIEGEIACAAGRLGPDNLLQFANMISKTEDRWGDNIFDGIIAGLQIADISEQDLLDIWKIAVKLFKINVNAKIYDSNNTMNKIYISDLHYAISLCAQRLGYLEIESKLQKIAPIEYNEVRLDSSEHNKIIPHRWFESHYNPYMVNFINETKEMNIDKMFEYIQTSFNNDNKVSWKNVQYFISRAKKEAPGRIDTFKASILSMLNTRNKDYTLEFDGSNNAYEELFPYMSQEEIDTTLKRIIDTYYYCKSIGFSSIQYGLMTDLDHFTFFLMGNYDFHDNIKVLNKILAMHCMWLCGTETFSLNKLVKLRESDNVIDTWSELCDKLRLMINI